MVLDSDAVVDPGTMVVEPSYAAIASGTVFGTKGATNLWVCLIREKYLKFHNT